MPKRNYSLRAPQETLTSTLVQESEPSHCISNTKIALPHLTSARHGEFTTHKWVNIDIPDA